MMRTDAGRARSSACRSIAGQRCRRRSRACCSTSRSRPSTTSNRTASSRQHFTLTVVDLPTVEQLDLEYRFPAYTGLAPRKVDDGGDVAAHPRHRRRAARHADDERRRAASILLNDGAPQPLDAQADGTLTGSFKIDEAGLLPHRARPARTARRWTRRRSTRSTSLDDQPPSVALHQAGTRHAGEPGRGAVRSKRAPTTTSA